MNHPITVGDVIAEVEANKIPYDFHTPPEGVPKEAWQATLSSRLVDEVQSVVDRAKAGEGPTLIIAETYRWKGHSRSDKNLYRTKEEIEEWRTKDPIPKFISRVLEAGLLTQEQCDEVQNQAIDAIKAAVNEAVKAESAEPSGLLDAVFKAVSA